MSFETTALLMTWVALVLLALVVAGLVRQVHHLTRAPSAPDAGPQIGMPAPGLEHLEPEPDRPVLLLFLDDDCPACHDVFQEALVLTGAPPTRALFSAGALAADPPPHLRILAGRRELFDAYQVPATPFAVVVGTDGRIRTAEPVGSIRALHALVARSGGRVVADPGEHPVSEPASQDAAPIKPETPVSVPVMGGPAGRRNSRPGG